MNESDPQAERRRRALRQKIDLLTIGSVNAFATAAGVRESTVRAFLSGASASMSDRTYEKLARRYGLSIAQLKGEEEDEGNAEPLPKGAMRTSLVPVVGYVGGGAEVFYPEGDASPIDEVEVPGDGKYVEAVILRGDSMAPVYRDNDVIVYRQATHVPRDLFGDECVVRLADGRTFVKILMPGKERGLFTLVSHNPTVPPITDVAIEWAVPVEMRISRRWRHRSD